MLKKLSICLLLPLLLGSTLQAGELRQAGTHEHGVARLDLAQEGMTMICVTHEMGFARQVANRVIFMDQGQIVEQNTPAEFFDNPQHERTKLFLSQILH